MGKQEWERAVAFEAYERARNEGLPQLGLFPDQTAQAAAEERLERQTREYLERKGFQTFPDWLQHYRIRPLPDYLEPLADLGVTDDLTSPTRLSEDATSYIPSPSPALGYFFLANAR